MKRTLPLLAVLALSGCAASTGTTLLDVIADTAETGPTLTSIVEECELPESALMDDGASLMLDGEGEDDSVGATGKLTIDQLGCALIELETPESTISKMSQTRALDGMQSDAHEGFEYTWTYHPDAGLDVIITTIDA